MSESKKKATRFPCHIYGIEDAKEVYDTFQASPLKYYGDDVSLEDGTVLHDNYAWDDGRRTLVRCKKCRGLMIRQSSVYESFSDAPDGYYEDWIPVASEKEADLLNILLGAGDLEDYPCRHLRKNNRNFFWTKGNEPEANDPEELIRQIREKYAGLNPALLEKLIQDAL